MPPAIRLGLLPLALYSALFAVMTWPAVLSGGDRLLGGDGDSFVYVWNIWWVRTAALDLGQSWWHTLYLHHPEGATLIGHSLNPISGMLGLVVSGWNPAQIYNLELVLSFVLGGVFAFLLAYREAGHWGGALVGGFVFAFSGYHFAHAQGHLCLTSLHLLPLSALAWLSFLERPRVLSALAAAVLLWLNLLCTFYYLFYSSFLGLALVLHQAWARRDPGFLFRPAYRGPFAVFAGAAGVLVGPTVAALLRSSMTDPFVGVHAPDIYSLDLLAPLVPGAFSRFADGTRPYWERLPLDEEEGSLYVGWAVVALLAYAWVSRRHLPGRAAGRWFTVAAAFGVLALGPGLRVAGRPITGPFLPYALLDALPGVSLSGVPVRLFVLVTLAAGVLVALAVARLSARGKRGRAILAVGLVLLVVEHLPSGLETTSLEVPGYVTFLEDAAGREAVIDSFATSSRAMYYQTRHQRPLASGYLSRTPTTTMERAGRLERDLAAALATGDLAPLRGRGFRYLVARADPKLVGDGMPVVFRGEGAVVLDLDLGVGAGPVTAPSVR